MACFDNTTITSKFDFSPTVISLLNDFSVSTIKSLNDFSGVSITCTVFDRAQLSSDWVTLTLGDTLTTISGDQLVFTGL